MRKLRFTFLCNDEERQLVATLAETLQRSQSDALRWLVREAIKELRFTADAYNDEIRGKISKGGLDDT